MNKENFPLNHGGVSVLNSAEIFVCATLKNYALKNQDLNIKREKEFVEMTKS